jgi:hypothetical protein
VQVEFPIGDTLAGGDWRVTEHLLGSGSQLLHAGQAVGRAGDRCMVSVIWAPRGAPAAEIERRLGYRAPGVLELVHVGPFDARGDDELRRTHQAQHCALVERVPAGADWLPRLVSGPIGPRAAVLLGLSLGRILERAAAAGHLLVGVRPEYVWARRGPDGLEAAGATGRNWDFFEHTGGGCLVPGALFRRHYLAPEVYLQRGDRDESLVFTLAVLIAEWASGDYPFPDAWAGGNMLTLVEGRHAPLRLPAALAELLALALKAQPAHRFSLSTFLRRLALFTPAELGE